MSKLLFVPFSVIAGVLSGKIGKRLFESVWSFFDADEPPDPRSRDASWRRVVFALLLQGAIFRAVRGVADRASREAFSKLTGSWPGDEHAEPT
jgi:hypothetical protein